MAWVRIAVTPQLHQFQRSELTTTYHAYLRGDAFPSSEVDVFAHEKKRTTALKYELHTDTAIQESAIFAIDCFMEEVNAHGQLCNQRVGSASFPLVSLWRAGRRGMALALHHDSSQLEQGVCRCVATFDGTPTFADARPDTWSLSTQESLVTEIDSYVKTEMSVFNERASNRWYPSHPFLQRVHAPLHYSRTTIVPGIAFWMTGVHGVPQCDEAWCEHWLTIVQARHGRDETWMVRTVTSQFEAHTHVNDSFRECASMIVEAACSVINSFEYISDWVPDARGRHKYCESFDEILVRRSGDCEDGAKGIIEILTAFRDGAWEREMMKSVARVCRLYVSFGMLGMVDAPTIRAGRSQQYQAHMFMNWVPVTTVRQWLTRDPAGHTLATAAMHVEEWIGEPLRPWMTTLDILNGEGTGHVQPNVDPYERVGSNQQRLELHLVSSAQPPFVDRMMRPSWLPNGAPHRTFYKMHVHAYTNAFFERGESGVGSFTFINASTKHYGVPYDDAIKGRGTVSMRPHLALSPRLQRSLRSILNLEHPMPHMAMETSSPPWRRMPIGARVPPPEVKQLDWIKHCLHNWTTTTPSFDHVYTDLFIHPARMQETDASTLHRYIAALGVKELAIVPEIDPNCAELCSIRIRLFW